MMEVWLKTNRRALALGLLVPGLLRRLFSFANRLLPVAGRDRGKREHAGGALLPALG